jgi:hypothetical protein
MNLVKNIASGLDRIGFNQKVLEPWIDMPQASSMTVSSQQVPYGMGRRVSS